LIKQIAFEEIKSIWKEHLWPAREEILPMSNMRYKDIPYTSISKRYTPSFFAYIVDDEIAGVNSGHCSSRFHYRSRGLYVFPEYRKQGIGTKLLEHVCNLGRDAGMVYCWSLPRRSALKTYINAGFEQTSGFSPTDTNEENCHVRITL
jgi:GNAT superfamily N-acetyltransferase